VAIKMVLHADHAGPDLLARFRVEAEAVARLQHPNIVQIYEIGEQEGRPFVTLEFLEGGSLAQLLRREPLSGKQAAELIETLARAVHAVHQKGVVHRDLKPGNVLLTAGGQPKITDFGLAKLMIGGSEQTQPGMMLGTPSYMAPEQADGAAAEVGPSADIHALGAILYEMLTGRPPFQGETVADTLRQLTSQEPIPPRRLRAGSARDLDTICLKCLEKGPRQRYADAQTLADDLARFRAGEPILARPAGRLQRLAKWGRRRPAAAALILICALATVTLVGGSLWYQAQLEDSLVAIGNEKEAARQAQLQAEHGRLDAEVQRDIAAKARAAMQAQRDEARQSMAIFRSSAVERFAVFMESPLSGFQKTEQFPCRRYVEGPEKVLRPGGRLFVGCVGDEEPGTQGPEASVEEGTARRFMNGSLARTATNASPTRTMIGSCRSTQPPSPTVAVASKPRRSPVQGSILKTRPGRFRDETEE
jgi:Protein kinase domain